MFGRTILRLKRSQAVILARARTWQQCQKFMFAKLLPAYKTETLALPQGRRASLQSHICSGKPTVPLSILVSEFRLLRPIGIYCKTSSRATSSVAMAGQQQSSIAAQPSGVLQQETTTQEIPLSISTPTKDPHQGQASTAGGQIDQPSGAMTSGFSQSLADRIKSGSGRRKATKTTEKDVGAAAVDALSDIINAMIMPGQGATERYLDSRDANRSVPGDIPGASCEQEQHAKQPATRPASHAGQTSDAALPSMQQSTVQTPEPRSRKSTNRRQSKEAKAAVLQTASELALGPDVYEDKLQEDKKVCGCAGFTVLVFVCLCSTSWGPTEAQQTKFCLCKFIQSKYCSLGKNSS